MADSFTADKVAALEQGTGDNENTWGDRLNDETIEPMMRALAGYLSKGVAGAADVTLNATEAQYGFLKFIGALLANINVIVPSAPGFYSVWNATSGNFSLTVKTAAGTGIAVTQDTKAILFCDGTNVIEIIGTMDRDVPADSGSSNAYVAGPKGAIPTQLRAGLPFAFIAASANSGSSTLAWASLAAKALFKPGTTGPVALAGGEIQSGQVVAGVYDGVQFVITSLLANIGQTAGAGLSLSGSTLNQAEVVNAQSGTAYTVVANDLAKLLTFTNASAIAVTLPQATGSFAAGFFCDFACLPGSTGSVTITPATSTIDGAASLTLRPGQSARVVSDGTNYSVMARPALPRDYIHIRDEKAAGTAGGTATSGSWQTRTLNTEVSDAGSLASLSSNQITLAAGTYECRISAPANYVGVHQTRLRNVTGSTTVLVGTSEANSPADSAVTQTRSVVVGRFTVAASQALEVQHQVASSRATDGFGSAANFGEVEVFTVAEFWRVA